MEQEQTNPPEVTPATDGTPDVELLRAISANAECAHILAAIAAGGNPKELLATLLPTEGKPEAEEQAAKGPEVAMYQSPSQAAATDMAGDSYPAFLATETPDFWEGIF